MKFEPLAVNSSMGFDRPDLNGGKGPFKTRINRIRCVP